MNNLTSISFAVFLLGLSFATVAAHEHSHANVCLAAGGSPTYGVTERAFTVYCEGAKDVFFLNQRNAMVEKDYPLIDLSLILSNILSLAILFIVVSHNPITVITAR